MYLKLHRNIKLQKDKQTNRLKVNKQTNKQRDYKLQKDKQTKILEITNGLINRENLSNKRTNKQRY